MLPVKILKEVIEVGKHREPVDLLIAKGKKHLTKEEIEKRKAQELVVPFKDANPPEYLTEKQKEEFKHYASMLEALNIFTDLDIDCLGRYILAHSLYLTYTKKLNALIKKGTVSDINQMQNMQDKAFKQCQSSARDLGLTITSRCKIVMPEPPDDDDEL